jgi:acyl-CoA thioester hydrolase
MRGELADPLLVSAYGLVRMTFRHRSSVRPSSRWRSAGARLHECSVDFEVPFHDVDALRAVWHGHYYKYLELARTRLMRSRGLDGADLGELAVGLVMIESRCRYVAPLRYGDRGQVRAWFTDIDHRLSIGYEISNLTLRKRAATARTVLASVDSEGRMLLRTPEVIRKRLLPVGEAERSTATESK